MSGSARAMLEAPPAPAAARASTIPWWRGWPPLVLLPAAAVWLTAADRPRWVCMASLVWAILFACKWLTWRRTPERFAPWWQHAGYLAAWPGMDAAAFLDTRRRAIAPTRAEWLLAVGKPALGVWLLYGVAHRIPASQPLLVGGLGIAGLVLTLHFGVFHLLACAWRQIGVEAQPIMNWPITAASTTDFWRRRWNLAFHDLAHRFVFRPLAPRLGAAAALWVAFLVSGLIHDLVISFPAQGGYGGPTLYFLLQAAAIFVERSRPGRRLGLAAGLRGRLFTLAMVVVPLPLLFHPPLLSGVIVPLMRAMGAIA